MVNCRNNHSGRIRLCPLRLSDLLSACAFRSVCRYRCFCAGTGPLRLSDSRRSFLILRCYRFSRSFRLGGRLSSFSCRFRCPESVLSLLGSCPVVAEAVGRFLRIFHPAVIRRAVVLPVRGIVSVPVLSSRICSRIVYPESVSIRMCGRRPRKRLQDRVENGGGATVFSVAMIFGIPTSGVPCFSG